MGKQLLKKLGNAVGFQLAWVASVWGGAIGLIWPAGLILACFVIYTLLDQQSRRADLRMLLIVVPLGYGLDSFLVATNVYEFAHQSSDAVLAPVWIAFLWVGFALTLNHSLSFLRTHNALPAFFGLAGAPLAYWVAGNAFNAVTFNYPLAQTLVLIGLLWALALPIWLHLGSQPDREMEAV